MTGYSENSSEEEEENVKFEQWEAVLEMKKITGEISFFPGRGGTVFYRDGASVYKYFVIGLYLGGSGLQLHLLADKRKV